jgi:F0F1-type ATP synthase membrane subunit b/b'
VSPSWVTFAFEVANFLLLTALLAWLFFRPVRAALERRRSQLESEQRAAAEARGRAEREHEDALARRRAEQAELERSRDQLRGEAESEKQALLEAGRAQLKRERGQLDQELNAARRAQTRMLARDAAFAAHAIVQRLLAELKGPDLEELLLGCACRNLGELRARGPLAPLVIESAATLDAGALARLAAAAGSARADVTTRVDPELIAGLRVLTAHGLVDATVSGISAQAERLLVGRIESENQRHE